MRGPTLHASSELIEIREINVTETGMFAIAYFSKTKKYSRVKVMFALTLAHFTWLRRYTVRIQQEGSICCRDEYKDLGVPVYHRIPPICSCRS